MNAQDLRQFVDYLLAHERALKIQELLGQTRDGLSNITSTPGNPEIQKQFAASYEALKAAIRDLSHSITPAQSERLFEIKGRPFFGEDLISGISKQIADNALTPAVARDYVTKLFSDRERYLGHLTQLASSFSAIGVNAPTVSPGTAEIGVTLPRQLFHNRIDELNSQLKRFDLLFRFVSEATTGAAEHATVGEISASDPSFFFGLSPETVAQVASMFKWAVDTLGTIAKLKEHLEALRGQGIKKAQLKGVEEAIEEKIAAAVEAKVAEMMALRDHPAERQAELRKGLEWSLENVLAATDRGVTVELRFIPPPPRPTGEAGAGDDSAENTYAAFEAIEQTSRQLAFPAPSQTPVRELPSPDPPASTAA